MMHAKKYSETRNLPYSLVIKLIAKHQLPATKLLTRWYIDEEEADKALKERCLDNLVPVSTGINPIKLLKMQALEETRRL